MSTSLDRKGAARWGFVGYWTCAAGTCVAAGVPFLPERWIIAIPLWYVWLPFGPEVLWLISFAGLRHFGRARGLSYRWFFVTAPFAFFDWLEGLLMIIFWLFTGFAP
jgi:hypothetical protein